MKRADLSVKAERYLQRLCVEIAGRPVGSRGNQAATDFFADVVAATGFAVDTPAFDCIDWHCERVRLVAGGTSFEAFASPYSLGCQVSAPLAVVSTVQELEAASLDNAIVLLRREIAREPLMPKSFDLYNPEEHQRIVRILETRNPPAVVTATRRNPEMAGAAYPSPLIEDGDVDVPSVYMTEEEGERLAAHAGAMVLLESRAQRIPSRGCNVIARRGRDPARRVVLTAHIDTKMGTPGAIDNGGGVVVLLLLAKLLADYAGERQIEIIALNGEDYYAIPGQRQFLARNAGRFDEIALGINLDGVGYHKGLDAYSLYDCPPDTVDRICETFAGYENLTPGEPWYQGDHMLLVMNQQPALAITSELATEVLAEIAHSERDRPEIVDATRLAALALALRDLLVALDRQPL